MLQLCKCSAQISCCRKYSSGTDPAATYWPHHHVCAEATLPGLLSGVTGCSSHTSSGLFLQDRGLLKWPEDSHGPVRNVLKTVLQSKTLPIQSTLFPLLSQMPDAYSTLRLSLPNSVPSFTCHRCFPNKSLAGLIPCQCLPTEGPRLKQWPLALFLQVRRHWTNE